MAHFRRNFFDLTASPALAAEPSGGSPPDQRRAVRQEQSRPRFDALRKWLDGTLLELPPCS